MPVIEYVTPARVKAAAGLRPDDTADAERLAEAAAAANAWASRRPGAPADPDDPEAADWVLGVLTLAARWYKRRTSPEGVQAIGDGLAVYSPRRDADVTRLMRLDKPRTG